MNEIEGDFMLVEVDGVLQHRHFNVHSPRVDTLGRNSFQYNMAVPEMHENEYLMTTIDGTHRIFTVYE